MKALKIFGSLFILIFVFVTLLGLNLPEQVSIQRSISVNAPISCVYSHVSDFKHWENWMSWEGTSMVENQQFCWSQSDQIMGNGCIQITDTSQNQFIKTTISLNEMIDGSANWDFERKSANETILNLNLTADMSKPMIVGPIIGALSDQLFGDQLQESLSMLKVNCEKEPASLATF